MIPACCIPRRVPDTGYGLCCDEAGNRCVGWMPHASLYLHKTCHPRADSCSSVFRSVGSTAPVRMGSGARFPFSGEQGFRLQDLIPWASSIFRMISSLSYFSCSTAQSTETGRISQVNKRFLSNPAFWKQWSTFVVMTK